MRANSTTYLPNLFAPVVALVRTEAAALAHPTASAAGPELTSDALAGRPYFAILAGRRLVHAGFAGLGDDNLRSLEGKQLRAKLVEAGEQYSNS